MRSILVFVVLVSLAVPVAAEPPKNYAQIRQQIAVVAKPDGSRIASSSPIADTKYMSRAMNGGHESRTAFAYVSKREAAPASVSIVATRIDVLFHTEIQNFDGANAPPKSGSGVIGDPWRNVPYNLLDNSIKCGASSEQMCMWTRTYQFNLSAEDVRAVLAAKKKILPVSTDSRWTEWTMPLDHFSATLDALGVLAEFQG